MSNKLWKALLASPAVLGMAISGSAIAADEPSVEALEAPSETVELAQVATVDELSDVLPTDWAYTALQNLVEEYGCIEGYPNRTFRGNNALTRYEFAAGLNSCLDVIAGLIGIGVDEGVLATIQRLQQEFQAELATLRGRVDALEAETAELRAQQFSTTTKLRGQVDANLIVPFGEATITTAGVAAANSDDNASFNARARLNFDASFTGEDRLRVRLQTGDDDFGSLQTAGGLANSAGTANSFDVDDFYYSFPVGSRLDLIIAANGIATDDFVTSTIVPFDGPSVADAGGPVLYDAGVGGGGFAGGFSFAITDNFVLDAGYSADQDSTGTLGVAASNNPSTGGIFGATSQSSIVQLSYLSDGFFNGALTYINGTSDGATQVDTYAALASLDFGHFIIGGYWAQHDVSNSTTLFDDVSWQAGIAFPDVFIEGSQLGVYYADLASFAPGVNGYMYEGYYEIPVNQFLTITPALIYGDLDTGTGVDDDNFYGAIRATFSF